MSGCTPEMAQELERWLEGELQRRDWPVESQRRERPVESHRRERPADARADAALEAHLATCAACRAHCAWLRAERDLFDARARADRVPVPDFDGVLARMQAATVVPLRAAPERPRWRFVDARAFALSLCAAAALLCVALPQRTPDAPTATPEPRAVQLPAAVGIAEGEGEEACGTQSCCSTDESPCGALDEVEPAAAVASARSEDASGASSGASMPVSAEISCAEGSCSSTDHSATAHAFVIQRSDLTCSEDL